MQRDPASPCAAIDSAGLGAGDFGQMDCAWARHNSLRKVALAELPVSIFFRCDSNDDIHSGWDSVASPTTSFSQPWGNVECQSTYAQLDYHGDSKPFDLVQNVDELQVTINADRTVDFRINGGAVMHTAVSANQSRTVCHALHASRRNSTDGGPAQTAAIPAASFPVHWAIASADGAGYLRNMHWHTELAHWYVKGLARVSSHQPVARPGCRAPSHCFHVTLGGDAR